MSSRRRWPSLVRRRLVIALPPSNASTATRSSARCALVTAAGSAVEHAVRANARHGLHRTNADKKRLRVLALLEPPDWRTKSSRDIALCVSPKTPVEGVRPDKANSDDSKSSTASDVAQLATVASSTPPPAKWVGRDGKACKPPAAAKAKSKPNRKVAPRFRPARSIGTSEYWVHAAPVAAVTSTGAYSTGSVIRSSATTVWSRPATTSFRRPSWEFAPGTFARGNHGPRSL